MSAASIDNQPHPIIAAMNTLGYEVGTLGNHEFNYGLDFLEAAMAGAQFPFVSANVVRGAELAADPLDDDTLYRALPHRRKGADRRRRRNPHDQHRLHRLPAAPDHDLGRRRI